MALVKKHVLAVNDLPFHGPWLTKQNIGPVRVKCYMIDGVDEMHTVSDWVPKKDDANFESDTFLWFAYVVNMSKIAKFLGRFWIFG